MKINEQDSKRAEQDMSSLSGSLTQFMQTQFQSTLAQFQQGQVEQNSPLNKLMGTRFLESLSDVQPASNPANLNTQSNPEVVQRWKAQLDDVIRNKTAEKLEIHQPENLSTLAAEGRVNRPATSDSQLKFQDVVQEASQKYDVPVALINAMIKQESAFNPTAKSHAGAEGLMQLMPATAKAYGCHNSSDPRENVMAGTRFMSDLLKKYKGDVELALAGYNAGPGNVAKYGNQVPPFKETQNYVVKVQDYYKQNLAVNEQSAVKLAQFTGAERKFDKA